MDNYAKDIIYCEDCRFREILDGADRYRCKITGKLLAWSQRSCEAFEQVGPDEDPRRRKYIYAYNRATRRYELMRKK